MWKNLYVCLFGKHYLLLCKPTKTAHERRKFIVVQCNKKGANGALLNIQLI